MSQSTYEPRVGDELRGGTGVRFTLVRVSDERWTVNTVRPDGLAGPVIQKETAWLVDDVTSGRLVVVARARLQ